MNKTLLVIAIAFAAAAGVAQADPPQYYEHQYNHGPRGHLQPGSPQNYDHDNGRWDHDHDNGRWDHDHDNGRGDADRNDQRDRYQTSSRYEYPNGYRKHRWQRGEYLPESYRADRYQIKYADYNLRKPPRGYHWIRVDNDVALASNRSGQIIEMANNRFR